MPLTPDRTPADAGLAARLRYRRLWPVAVVVLLGAGAASAVGTSSSDSVLETRPGPARSGASKATGDRQADQRPDSQSVAGPTPSGMPATTLLLPTPGRPDRPTTSTTPTGTAPGPVGPLGRPGTGAPAFAGSPTTGTTTPRPTSPGPTTPTPTIPTPTVPEPTIPTPTIPEAPVEVDRERCPNLRLVAIGDAPDAPPAVAARSTAFRAEAAAILASAEHLVCARPMTSWRDDLAIQELRMDGRPAGTLVAGLDPGDPVIRFTTIEWISFKDFRAAGSTNHNFGGVPVRRQTIGGVAVLRTTKGGLVMPRADSWGQMVVAGAWDVWMAHGGPTGDMGLPEAKPTGTEGLGAHQDFTRGTLVLPGVELPLEAEAQPADRYRWEPLTPAQLAQATPPPNSLVGYNGTSYYVDAAGVRHWIGSIERDDWGCAKRLPGVTVRPDVRGWVLARLPLGPAFNCPS